MAGGNGILSVLSSPGASMDAGMTSPQAAMSAPLVTDVGSDGGAASLGHVQVGVAALLLLSIAALVLLNKAGFRFSVTVG